MLRRLFNRDYPLSGVGSNETTGLSIYDWAKMFAPGSAVSFGGNTYQAFKTDVAPGGALFTSNASVFALESVRILLFSEARFQFQQMRGGRPGDLFGTPDLQVLEEPWPGHTTRDLLARLELDTFGAGNSYWVRNPEGLVRLEPGSVKLMIGKARENDLTGAQIGDKLLGYAYVIDRKTVAIYTPDQVAHYKPYPDPKNPFLGVSWLSACLPDVALDDTISKFKSSVVGNGAALSTVVTFDPTVSREQFDGFVDRFRMEHERPENAAKTLFLGGGADVKTIGQTFQDLSLQASQGAGEVRIAACAGIPPAIVGFSEGLRGSTLNAGNYGEARRRLADGTMRPLWGSLAGALSSLVPAPQGARLWYDDRDIAFLREDIADQANILAENSKSVMTLVQAGWEPDAAIEAVTTGDLTRLHGQHTGLYSVQLQPPSSGEMQGGVEPAPAPAPAPLAPVRELPSVTTNVYPAPVRHVVERNGHRQPDIHVHPPKVDVAPANVNVKVPDVHFRAGDTHIEAARAPNVHVSPPAVHVQPADVHVDVAAPKVTVQRPAVHVRSPDVNVAAPEVHVAAPNVSVQPADVRVAAPNVNVQPADVHVDVAAPDVHVRSPDVHVEAPPAPNVNVEAPVVHVTPPAVNVDVPAPIVNVAESPRRKVRRRIERDEDGNPTGTVEEEFDDET